MKAVKWHFSWHLLYKKLVCFSYLKIQKSLPQIWTIILNFSQLLLKSRKENEITAVIKAIIALKILLKIWILSLLSLKLATSKIIFWRFKDSLWLVQSTNFGSKGVKRSSMNISKKFKRNVKNIPTLHWILDNKN